ncbi:MAG: hypothetical protein KBD85_04750 [Elusimicrobia bacterium]|nr:hypothetical protein [Elusimicrobiota bacterium]MBP9128032.1 hypothetical protein [Elusimicrobiota bacterium]MBP9699311.1 hypothetical protein [Elusimicrobiota bacterium]
MALSRPVPRRSFPRQRGAVSLLIVFGLVIMLPLTLMFVRWLNIHRKQLTHSSVKLKNAYACQGASAEVERMLLVNGQNQLNLLTTWVRGQTASFSLVLDSSTTVTVNLTHEGP